MKRKLLLAALCVASAIGGGNSLHAQTDVTSTYITNPGFEGDADSDITKVGNVNLSSRAIKDPAAWSVTTSGTYNQFDASVLTSSDAQYSAISPTIGQTPVSSLGSKTYGVRFYNGGSSRSLILSQNPTLPRGVYEFSAELISKSTSNMKVGVYYSNYSTFKQEVSSSNTWAKTSISFTVTESRAVELGVYFTRNSGEAIGCADNVKLNYSNYTAELSSMIAKATALSNGSLSSAISTAQGVLNDKDNTVAYQTTIDNAVATLQAAIISAQSADGSSLTPAIQNPGFEGGQSWYLKTTGGDTYDVDRWTKSLSFESSTYHYSCLATDQKSEGSNSFKVRFNWADASQTFTQTIPGLRLGRYTITADVKVTNGSKSSIDAYIKGNSTKGESVTATTSGFQTITAVVDLNEPGSLDIILGMDYSFSGGKTSSECIVYWDNVTLTYNNPEALYTSTKSAAQDTYDDSDYDNVTGDERTALYGLLNPDPAPSTVAEYFAAIDDINDAVTAFTAAKTNYDKYAAEATNATALGVDPVPALDVASNYSDKLKALIVLEDAAVTSGYTENATGIVDAWDVANGQLKTWTEQNAGTGNTDHWSGNTVTYYNKYDGSGFTMSAKKTVSLPAGSYVLKAAARCDKVNGNDDFYLGVTVDGESLVKEIYTSTGGGSGLGIDKTGAANYTAADDTYANSNNGFGWEWRFVPFTLTETKDVELKITANILATGWVSFSDIQLLTTSSNEAVFAQIYNNAKTSAEDARDHAYYTNVDGKEKKDLTDAIDASVTASIAGYSSQKGTLDDAIAAFTAAKTNYNSLATAISNANTIVTNSINVGDGAFQVPTSIRSTLATAQATAVSTKSNEATTSSDAATAATTLNTAISTYNTDFAAAELNAPVVGKRYQIVNVTPAASFDYTGKALTFYVNPEQSEGGYGYQYSLDPDVNYAQGFIFTAVDGQKNVYTLSYVGLDGTTRYICSQYGYNENASGDKTRIRTTTNPTYALKVRVDVTTTANVWKLYNTEAEKNIGTNGKSNSNFFTNADRSDIKLQEVSKASVTASARAGKFGTVIFPFTPDVSTGFDDITFYSCESEDNGSLTLEEVATPKANTPYLIKNTGESNFSTVLSGWGVATTNQYTDAAGLLTGIYTAATIPDGSYVLQTPISTGVQAFYPLATTLTGTPYRCYLALPNSAAKRNAIFFDKEEGTTGIEAPNAINGEDGVFYNLAGQRVNRSYKGIIIQNRKAKLNN